MTRLLQRIFSAQARDVAQHVTPDGDAPDLTPWIAATANAVKPLLLRLYQAGAIQAQRRIADKLRQRGRSVVGVEGMRRHEPGNDLAFGSDVGKAVGLMRRHVTKTANPPQHPFIMSSFEIFNPRIYDAVDAAAFAFCRDTMETARTDLDTALAELRRALKRGLGRGEAQTWLARKVQRIFADPFRASRISVTETSRAVNGGEFIAAKESNVCEFKEWVASPDACELCLSIADKGPIPMDEPFYVNPKGGPYAVCMYPPAHPWDQCTWSPVI